MNSSSAKPASTASDRQLAAIVQVLDRQLLAAAHETLKESEKAELLAWAHQHLMAPVIDLHQRAREPGYSNKTPCDEGTRFSLDCIDIIHLLLAGETTVGQGCKFRGIEPLSEDDHLKIAAANGEIPLAPELVTRSRDRVEHFHRQLTHTAQRTRFHRARELASILKAADANVIVCALTLFHLGSRLHTAFPAPDTFESTGSVFLLAAEGCLSIAWTKSGPVFQALKPPLGRKK